MNNYHLSPCPFCRTRCAEISHGETRHWAYCTNCGAHGPCGETSRDAAEHWNASQYLRLNLRCAEFALQRAEADLREWAQYVPDYFQNKHNFKGDVDALNEAIRRVREGLGE